MTANQSFFEKRMSILGVTDEKNKMQIINPEAEFPMPKVHDIKIFEEDKDGNIVLNYWNIHGEQIVYYNDNKTPMPRFFQTKRLKQPQGDRKYHMPKGQGTFPWFAPSTVEKFKKEEKIETIYLTEGVFKAWKGCDAGMDVIGLSSITHYKQHGGELYKDIQRLIETCHVQNVVVLWDGDCLNIGRNDVHKREDLAKRPRTFFNQVKSIRKLVQKITFEKTRGAPDIYFMHVRPEAYTEKPKGLDDLLIVAEQKGQIDAVVKQALQVDKKSQFFYKHNITSTDDRLFDYFGLRDVEVFYRMHGDQIGENDFFFQQDHYYYDDNKNKLEMITPGWAKSLKWIGDEFFEEVTEPSARGDRKVLKKYSKETLKDRYGRTFIQHLKHFAGFCNVPSHFNYEQIVERAGKQFYNRYFPFRHDIEQGDCQLIINFFKHIFGEHKVKHADTGKEYANYELGLDYIQLMLTQPTQALPVICLYSKENATGKSTFGKLMQRLFSDNCVQVGNADLQSDFNETYADKILAICEETLLERKRDAERVKALSTSNQMLVNPKGQRQYSIDFFCKFWFFSNNIRMIYVTKHDERYWIMTVPKPKKEDSNLEQRMYEQIPAFIHYLKNRALVSEQDSRMWFHKSLIKTDTLQEIVKVNEPADATELREGIKELFLASSESTKHIEMPMTKIKQEFFGSGTNTRWIQELLTDYLEVDLLRDAHGAAVYKRGEYHRLVWNEMSQDFSPERVRWKGRPYVFHRDKFIAKGEVIFKKIEGENTEVALEYNCEKNEDLPF